MAIDSKQELTMCEGDWLWQARCTPPTKGILSKLPSPWVPYAELIRLTQPHGIYMICFPHVVGLIFGSSLQDPPVPLPVLAQRAGILLIWTFFWRSAGCAWNDNIDQEFDRKTARCRNRPIARNAVSTSQRHIFTFFLVLMGFAALQALPIECTLVGIGSQVLAMVYPFGKRFTHYAQVILGTTLASTVPLSAYLVGFPALSSSYFIPTCFVSCRLRCRLCPSRHCRRPQVGRKGYGGTIQTPPRRSFHLYFSVHRHPSDKTGHSRWNGIILLCGLGCWPHFWTRCVDRPHSLASSPKLGWLFRLVLCVRHCQSCRRIFH